MTSKQVVKRLEGQWPDYLYKGKPIMDQWNKASKEVAYEIDEFNKVVEFYAKRHPDWSKDKINKQAAEGSDPPNRVFGQDTDFLWLYDLDNDEFHIFGLNEVEMQRAMTFQKVVKGSIELYAK